jgi:hypothetical protein
VESELKRGQSFERSIRAGLKGVLIAPDFLFLRETPGKLDDIALASRLSYFLWSSMPDEELLAIAARGELAKPDALRRQVERMLKDPRAKAFTQNFAGQWLNLRAIDDTVPTSASTPSTTTTSRLDDPRALPLLRRAAEGRPQPDPLRRVRLQRS